MTTHMIIAAIQPQLEVGAPERNLERLEALIRDAYRAHQPDLMVLPEAMTSPNTIDPRLRTVPRPIDGAPLNLMSLLAREFQCCIAGGFLAIRGRHAYGTYALVEPDGRAHLHDKDIPSGTENLYYRGGDDDGVTTVAGWDRRRVGLASGMEWARVRTARRLRDAAVQLVVGGQCWPWTPEDRRGPVGRWLREEYVGSQRQCRELPPIMARLVGAPTVMASHVGPVDMLQIPSRSRFLWQTHMVGETHICDRDGSTLAHLCRSDGEGHIAARVELDAPTPTDALPDSYWTTDISAPINAAFHASNVISAAVYRFRTLRGQFPWQTTAHTNLPDEVPPRPASSRSGPAVRSASHATTVVTVRRREMIADDVVHLALASLDGTPLPRWKPGAHIDLILDDETVRQYSLCGDPAEPTYEIAVLREREGTGGSAWVHDKIAEGDHCRIRGPRNHFRLENSPRYLFIAGGIGITPLRPMIQVAATRNSQWRLLYGGRTAASMAFSDEFAQRYVENIELHPQDSDGLLDLDAHLANLEPGTLVYCCGPEPLLNAVETRCRDLPDGTLHIERFLPRKDQSHDPDTSFTIQLARTGRTLTVPAHRSVLDTLLDEGIDMDYSCQTGVCGTCEVAILDGTPEHRDSITSTGTPDAEKRMMTCVSRARTSKLTLDL
jgi:ferredoxin-NADP reductase/predicted amidohydrolase